MSSKKIEKLTGSGPLDPQMRIALLSASSTVRKFVRNECEKLGLRDCTDFTYAHELIPILKVTSCHLLITAGDIGDMHWATFFRALRSDGKIPHIPALFIPSMMDSTFKHHSGILEPMHIGVLHHFDPAAPVIKGLDTTIQQLVNDDRNVGSYESKLNEAKEFYRAGLKLQAQRVYRSLAKEKPDDHLAKIGVIQTSEIGDKQTLDQITHLIASDPANYCFWFELLNYFMSNRCFGKFAEAFDAFSADLRTASDAYWLYHLATLCLSLRQPKFAARCVKLLEENQAPNCEWMTYYIRTRIYLDEGNLSQAEHEIKLAAAKCKFQSAEIHNVSGIIQKRLKQHAESLESFSKAALITPLDYRIQYNLALAYLETGQKGRAIQALHRAIEIYPNYSRAASKLDEVNSG